MNAAGHYSSTPWSSAMNAAKAIHVDVHIPVRNRAGSVSERVQSRFLEAGRSVGQYKCRRESGEREMQSSVAIRMGNREKGQDQIRRTVVRGKTAVKLFAPEANGCSLKLRDSHGPAPGVTLHSA
jgi:hypothetical protein